MLVWRDHYHHHRQLWRWWCIIVMRVRRDRCWKSGVSRAQIMQWEHLWTFVNFCEHLCTFVRPNSGGFVEELVQHSPLHFCKQPGSVWHRSICLLYVCNCMLGVCCVITDIGGELFTEEGETETSHRSHYCPFKFIEKEICVNIGMLHVWKECLLAPLQYFATRKAVSMKKGGFVHPAAFCVGPTIEHWDAAACYNNSFRSPDTSSFSSMYCW